MLFETLAQPWVFLLLVVTGFASGFAFDLATYVVFLCKGNRVVKVFADLAATLAAFAVFYGCVLWVDYGATRAYHALTFVLFLTIEQLTLGKFFAKAIDKCYTLLVKMFEQIAKGLQKIKWKNRNKL